MKIERKIEKIRHLDHAASKEEKYISVYVLGTGCYPGIGHTDIDYLHGMDGIWFLKYFVDMHDYQQYYTQIINSLGRETMQVRKSNMSHKDFETSQPHVAADITEVCGLKARGEVSSTDSGYWIVRDQPAIL